MSYKLMRIILSCNLCRTFVSCLQLHELLLSLTFVNTYVLVIVTNIGCQLFDTDATRGYLPFTLPFMTIGSLTFTLNESVI